MIDVLGDVRIIFVAGVLIFVGAYVIYALSEDTKTLEAIADATLVSCDAYSALSDVPDRLIDDPELKRTLAMMKWGKSVSAGDVNSLDSYLKSKGKTVAFDSLCKYVGR